MVVQAENWKQTIHAGHKEISSSSSRGLGTPTHMKQLLKVCLVVWGTRPWWVLWLSIDSWMYLDPYTLPIRPSRLLS